MNDAESAIKAETEVAAANALDMQQRIFRFEKLRHDRFPSNSYQNTVDWRNTSFGLRMPTCERLSKLRCLMDWVLDVFTSMPAHFREQVNGFTNPTLRGILRTRSADDTIQD